MAETQETPPSGLQSINGQFYTNPVDGATWQQRGAPYGWQRLTPPNDKVLYKSVATYAEMIADGITVSVIQYKVTTDENEGLSNTIYQKWPDGTIILVPSYTSVHFQQVLVNTYAEMLVKATGTGNKLIFVKNDEVNGGTNADGSFAASIYQYSNGVLHFYLRTTTN